MLILLCWVARDIPCTNLPSRREWEPAHLELQLWRMNPGQWAILLWAVPRIGGIRNSMKCGSLGARFGTMAPSVVSPSNFLTSRSERHRERFSRFSSSSKHQHGMQDVVLSSRAVVVQQFCMVCRCSRECAVSTRIANSHSSACQSPSRCYLNLCPRAACCLSIRWLGRRISPCRPLA